MTIIVAIARSGSKEESCACALAGGRFAGNPVWGPAGEGEAGDIQLDGS